MPPTPPENLNLFSRRDFLKTGAAAATAAASGLSVRADAGSGKGPPLIGFQVEVPYIVEYGVERFLDDVQTRASVNTLFLHGNLYGPTGASAGRRGAFAAAHPEYYRDVGMEPKKFGPGDFDFPAAMAAIAGSARRRGLSYFSWAIEDNRPQPRIEGIERLYEVDLHGRRTEGHPGGPCLNNPYYRNLVGAEVEDWIRSYGIDGLQRGSERQGALGNALGAWHHGSTADPGRTSCFCDYCLAKARTRGIDPDRLRSGYLALEDYVRTGRAGRRPRDGYFVEFWRLLLRYPELVAWEAFWADSTRELQREVRDRAKAVNPRIPVGFHIWQNASFSPLYRAEQDYAPYLEYADFLKPVVYDNPAAERMASYVYSSTQNLFGDLSRDQALDFLYAAMGFPHEESYEAIIGGDVAAYEAQLRRLPINDTPRPDGRFARFSTDYVLRETRRAVQAVAGTRTRIWAGLGIDVVDKNSTPESVRGAVGAIFQAGADGLVICTSHAAMRPENLSAVGATLRDLRLVG